MDTDVLELIEEALDSTLSELLIARDHPVRRRAFTSDLAYWIEDECTRRSGEVLALAEIISKPAQASLKGQLTAIGWALFREVGSTSAMGEVADRIARLDPDNFEFRINALDSAFAGVGAGDDVWRQGACA